MKIAIPTYEGALCMHFGHCEKFMFIEIDENDKKIIGSTMIEPPPHEPGKLPVWIKSQGADIVICGGMGMRAQNIFQANGVQVVVGATEADPEKLAISYINGTLQSGKNACDH